MIDGGRESEEIPNEVTNIKMREKEKKREKSKN